MCRVSGHQDEFRRSTVSGSARRAHTAQPVPVIATWADCKGKNKAAPNHSPRLPALQRPPGLDHELPSAEYQLRTSTNKTPQVLTRARLSGDRDLHRTGGEGSEAKKKRLCSQIRPPTSGPFDKCHFFLRKMSDVCWGGQAEEPRLPSRPPPRDSPSGCCSFTGPWTVTRSSLRMLRRVAAFCRPLRPVLLLVSFPRSQSPVVGVPGLC